MRACVCGPHLLRIHIPLLLLPLAPGLVLAGQILEAGAAHGADPRLELLPAARRRLQHSAMRGREAEPSGPSPEGDAACGWGKGQAPGRP